MRASKNSTVCWSVGQSVFRLLRVFFELRNLSENGMKRIVSLLQSKNETPCPQTIENNFFKIFLKNFVPAFGRIFVQTNLFRYDSKMKNYHRLCKFKKILTILQLLLGCRPCFILAGGLSGWLAVWYGWLAGCLSLWLAIYLAGCLSGCLSG